MNVVIVSGSPNLDLTLLDQLEYEYVIGVDQGAYALIQAGYRCDLAVGDFDSTSPQEFDAIKSHCEIVTFSAIKNETDTELALTIALQRGAKSIHLIGATGKRLDHFLGTLNLYHRLKGIPMTIYDQYNKIYLIEPGTTSIPKGSYTYISFFSFGGPVEGLTLEGFKYPLNDYRLENLDSLTISNEIIREVATVRFREGRLLVVESRD